MNPDNSFVVDVKKLEKYVMILPAAKQANKLSTVERNAMISLTDSVSLARKNIVSLYISDDTAEQALFLAASIEAIKSVQKYILAASQYDLLGVADVAHLSALAEHIEDRL